MYKRLAAILAVLVAFVAVILYGITQANTTASADAPKTETGPVTKVTICHFTSIHASHPYNEITVPAFQFVFGVGHGGHQYDIWPAFKITLHGHVFDVPAHGNQSILRNHCVIPGETPPVTPCPTVTTTVTATVTVTAQPGKKTTPSVPPCSPTPTATVTTTETTTVTPNPTETVTATTTATATVTGPTSTVTVTLPFVPSTGCPPPNLFNAIRGNHAGNNMVGTPCRDVMAGHGGGDTMFGAAETDIMIGGRGNDRIDGGTSPDIIRGGFGNDRLISNDGTPGDRLVGGIGRDICIIDPGDIARQCERVIKK